MGRGEERPPCGAGSELRLGWRERKYGRRDGENKTKKSTTEMQRQRYASPCGSLVYVYLDTWYRLQVRLDGHIYELNIAISAARMSGGELQVLGESEKKLKSPCMTAGSALVLL